MHLKNNAQSRCAVTLLGTPCEMHSLAQPWRTNFLLMIRVLPAAATWMGQKIRGFGYRNMASASELGAVRSGEPSLSLHAH